jgi:hypothetical protein
LNRILRIKRVQGEEEEAEQEVEENFYKEEEMEVMDIETKMQRWNCDMKDFSPRSNQASDSNGLFFAVTCADAVCRSVKRGEILKEILTNEAHAFCLECAQCFQKNRDIYIYIYIYIYRDALCLRSLKICHKTDARKMLATQISSREEYSREASQNAISQDC